MTNNLIDSKTIIIYKDRALFCVCILSTIACVHYNYTKSHTAITSCLNVISSYCFVDIFFTEAITSKIHHLFAIMLFTYLRITNVSSDDYISIGYLFCKTEISSIFLVLKFWLNKKTVIYNINLALFYLSFMKIRVIDFYGVVSSDSPIYVITEKYSKDNYILTVMFVGSVYGFYILYIYWFIQINMILYKKIRLVNRQ
jgi:hypothetical protein